MKYRIKQIDNKYYPQIRILFMWRYFNTGNVLGSYPISYVRKLEAEKYIDGYISYKNIKPVKKIHKYDNY